MGGKNKIIRPVQIVSINTPTDLDHVFIRAGHQTPDVPDDVRKRVDDNWASFTDKKRSATDNQVAYVTSYQADSSAIRAEAFTAGFRYNQWFNRDDKRMADSDISNQLGYNPLASWIIVVCDKGMTALFGSKKDFGNRKVSGFGGFTSQEDKEGEYINPERWVRRKLKEEFGDVEKAVISTSAIGLNYYPIVGPKGFDMVYVVEMDGTPEQIGNLFRENPQFSKQLINVHANPHHLGEFLDHDVLELTMSCIGGVISYVGSRFGFDGVEGLLKDYSGRDDVGICGLPKSGSMIELACGFTGQSRQD